MRKGNFTLTAFIIILLSVALCSEFLQIYRETPSEALAQSDSLQISNIDAPKMVAGGLQVTVKYVVTYEFTKNQDYYISTGIYSPEEIVAHNEDWTTRTYSGSGNRTFMFSFEAKGNGTRTYTITVWYWTRGQELWTRMDIQKFNLLVYWRLKTWHVPSDYPTIDTTIIAAMPGDTIEVGPGNYAGFLVDKYLNLVGSDAVVVGSVTLSADGVQLRGFTIKEGDLTIEGKNDQITYNELVNCSQIIIRGNESRISNNAIILKDIFYVNSVENRIIKNSINCQGIIVGDSFNQIIGNTISIRSIDLGVICAMYKTGNEFRGNSIKSEGSGIQILSGLHGQIVGNEIEAKASGITFGSGGMTVRSIDRLIENNTIKSSHVGISGVNLEIRGNTLSNCMCGIVAGGSCKIYMNNFINNDVQAQDRGTNNLWYTNLKGNFWSDWTGPDDNNDGIVDKPYVRVGGRNSDQYPLAQPAVWASEPVPSPEPSPTPTPSAPTPTPSAPTPTPSAPTPTPSSPTPTPSSPTPTPSAPTPTPSSQPTPSPEPQTGLLLPPEAVYTIAVAFVVLIVVVAVLAYRRRR